jgi:hypothetical protein
MRLNRPWFVALALIAAALAVLPGVPASAAGPAVEYLYAPTDPYLSQRVQEATDTSDVLLAVEWEPTADGVFSGVRICLDLSQQEVNARLPLTGDLWTSGGDLLGVAGAAEGIEFTAPCFYDLTMNPVPVTAGQRYVVGFWVRGGQYSYVPGGFATGRSNGGHLTAPSNVDSTVGSGNGLYAYTSDSGAATPFPVDSWQDSDYLVSPRFTPAAS